MAKTVFALTSDNGASSFPDDAAWPNSKNPETQATDRYASLGSTEIQFPSSNEGFNVPIARFTMLDAYGNRVTGAPKLQIRMPNLFNITNISDYAKTDNIFGASFSGLAKGVYGEAAAKEGFSAANFALTAADALQYAIKKGFASTVGFVESAGIGNIGQYEFSGREAVNPMSQMLYKGPQYRRYQMPFILKPKSRGESENIKKIISAFRLASSPSVPNTSGLSVGPTASASVNIGEGNSFSFGYPHLTQFDLLFYTDDKNSKRIFRSKPCVIESVSTDYGSQKMTFFEDGNPAEITLTVQLTEIVPRTLGDAKYDAISSHITLK
jgi:hypothetical protein